MLYRWRLQDEDVLHDRKTMRDEGEIIRIIRYRDRIWKWGVDIVRFLYVCVIHVSFSGVDWNGKGGAGREWDWRDTAGLQDWNPNAPHLRHEGNESGCLKMPRSSVREWHTQTKKPHFKDIKHTAHSLQSSQRKKKLPNPLCILLIGRPRPLGCPHSIYWKTK